MIDGGAFGGGNAAPVSTSFITGGVFGGGTFAVWADKIVGGALGGCRYGAAVGGRFDCTSFTPFTDEIASRDTGGGELCGRFPASLSTALHGARGGVVPRSSFSGGELSRFFGAQLYPRMSSGDRSARSCALPRSGFCMFFLPSFDLPFANGQRALGTASRCAITSRSTELSFCGLPRISRWLTNRGRLTQGP